MARETWLSAIVTGAVLSALFWIDALFVLFVLLGPLLVGAFAGWRRYRWMWPATVFVVAGLGAVVSDWLINREDVGFHLVLTLLMVGLALLGWVVARTFGSRRARAGAGDLSTG